MPQHVKEARRFNKTEFEAIINKYLWDADAARLAAQDEKTPPVERWMAAIVAKGLSTGEWSGFEWIAQRLLGKVKDQIEVTQPKPFVVRHLDGTQTVLGAKVEKDEE